MSWTLMCVDPGMTHLACAIFQGSTEDDLEMKWNYMYACGKDPCKMAHVAEGLSKLCQKYEVDVCLVEFQPPIGTGHCSHWNAYIEGALTACLCMKGIDVKSISSSSAKRALNLATGNYSHNKQLALKYAKKHCPTIGSHHVADCFILAKYFMHNTQPSL